MIAFHLSVVIFLLRIIIFHTTVIISTWFVNTPSCFGPCMINILRKELSLPRKSGKVLSLWCYMTYSMYR